MLVYGRRTYPNTFGHFLFRYFWISFNQFHNFTLTFYQPIYQPIYQPTLRNYFFRSRKRHPDKVVHKTETFPTVAFQNPWHARTKLLYQFQIPIHAHYFPIPWNGDPSKKSSSLNPSRNVPAEVISIRSTKISNLGGTSRVKSLCTIEFITASRIATGFQSLRSIRSLDVICVAVRFSNSILSNTLFVALISEQYPYSLFSIRSTRFVPRYFATFIDTPFSSLSRYAT